MNHKNALTREIDVIVREVRRRGWRDDALTSDDFATLRGDERIRLAIVAGLYEQYLLPKRHEFEWHVLYEIVRSITGADSVGFIKGVVVGGVLGNAAYHALKEACRVAVASFRSHLGPAGKSRANGFRAMRTDAHRLARFFRTVSSARIGEIERSTGVTRERAYPLMILAGARHARRGQHACMWTAPTTGPSPNKQQGGHSPSRRIRRP